MIDEVTTIEDLDDSPSPFDSLPSTPPNICKIESVKQLMCQKSYLSGVSLGDVQREYTNQVDALTAGVVRLPVPVLEVDEDTKVRG